LSLRVRLLELGLGLLGLGVLELGLGLALLVLRLLELLCCERRAFGLGLHRPDVGGLLGRYCRWRELLLV
jgi:hypothetical protein